MCASDTRPPLYSHGDPQQGQQSPIIWLWKGEVGEYLGGGESFFSAKGCQSGWAQIRRLPRMEPFHSSTGSTSPQVDIPHSVFGGSYMGGQPPLCSS